jgi:hypothetical protein
MKARDLAVLAGGLAAYDFVATAQLPVTADLFARLAGLPFAPVVVWPVGPGGLWLGVGLGDLLLASVAPLVLRKAFGRAAGVAAASLSMGAIVVALALALPAAGAEAQVAGRPFPVMVVLGPLLVLQYLYWRRQRGPERTTWQYLQAEPMPARPAPWPIPAGRDHQPSGAVGAGSQAAAP